nr:putative ribonuclease H-like domain-containing protein [Tanacetum cinerariifolium]
MAFVSSSNNNSINGSVNTAQAVNTAIGVSTAGIQVNTANINNLSDDVICAFLASQPNSPQLVNEDLEHIHPDDLEEMDLKWQMAMLTIRARRNTLLGSAELQEVKIPSTKKSEQAEEGPNFAFVAYTSSSSDSKVSTDSTCTKSCLETVKILKSNNEKLTKDLKKSEFMVLGYKTGLESVEERLKLFKTNESVYLVDINVLKVEIQMKDIAIKKLRRKLELAQKEKDNIQLSVDKLENASKSLNKLIDCQIVDNCKKGLGYENYNDVSPPYTGNFMPLKPDLSFTGLDEFANKPVVENSKVESSQEKPKEVKKNTDAPIIEECVSDDEDEEMIQSKFEQKIVKTSIAKIKFVKPKQVEKKVRKTVKQTHPNATKKIVPRAVLLKSGIVNTARQNFSKTAVLVNTVRQVNTAHPKSTLNAARQMSYISKSAHSSVKRPIQKNTIFNNNNVNQRVNTVRSKTVNTARPKEVVNAVQGNIVNVVKASTCWVWKPKTKGNPQIDLQDNGVIDSGCSRENSTEPLISPKQRTHLKLGLWYPKDSPIDLVAYTDSDYARVSLYRKSTTGGCQYLGSRLISWQCKKQTVVANPITEAEYMAASSMTYYCQLNVNDARHNLLLLGSMLMLLRFWYTAKVKTINGERHLHAKVDGKKEIISEASIRRDLQFADEEATILQSSSSQPQKTQKHKKPKRKVTEVPQPSDSMKNIADEAVYKELDDSLVRAATTASSLEVEQDSGNINKT